MTQMNMAESKGLEDLHTIHLEQRVEVMAAMAEESDLNLAFQLQMQEAMTVSRALQPSTSQPPSPDDSIIAALTAGDDDDDDDVMGMATALMLQDMERFTQECEDQKRCKEETKRTKEDLDRRIHDQKLAGDILNVPEDEWKKSGDNYERPYGFVASSSEAECLRLYCKGLVSEERIRDVKAVVAGAGIAICDPRNNLIFKAKKNLEAVDGGRVLGSEAAELEALIEGLNKALALDLNRVTFFCDDYMVYQYVTGRVLPRHSKIETLVNQVALLRRKFTYCSPSLVARNDMKFAFKFARDAVVSQISWYAETSNDKSLKETCIICFEDTEVSKMFSVDHCLHRYCFSCMRQHVEMKLLNGMVAKCPHEGCKSEVNIESCGEFLAPELVKVMSERKKESFVPVSEKVYCPYPRCSTLMSKKEVLEYTNSTHLNAEQSGVRKCMKCCKFFCINCRVPWHNNMTCNGYKRSNPQAYAEDQKLKSLATKKLWRGCPRCNHMVELAEGCYHITCRCQFEFCYTCGAEWKNKKPTCHCPIWDERNIIRDVRQRQR